MSDMLSVLKAYYEEHATPETRAAARGKTVKNALAYIRSYAQEKAGGPRVTSRFVVLRDCPDGRTVYAVTAVCGCGYGRSRRVKFRVVFAAWCDVREGDYVLVGPVRYRAQAGWVVYWYADPRPDRVFGDEALWFAGTNLAWGVCVNLAETRFAALEDVYDQSSAGTLLAFLRRLCESEEHAALVRAGFYGLATPRGISGLRRRRGIVPWLRRNATWFRSHRVVQADLFWMFDHCPDVPVSRAWAVREGQNAQRELDKKIQRETALAAARGDDRRILQMCSRYAALAEFRRQSYTVRIPAGVADLVREGCAMRNCVGGYGTRIASGACVVVFVRRDGRPCCDIEFDRRGEIVQCYEACNRTASDELWAIARELGGMIRNMQRRERPRREIAKEGAKEQ